MSKEEAELEERLRRNDDLRLQMAITESKEELKKDDVKTSPHGSQHSTLDDLLGLQVDNALGGAPSLPPPPPPPMNSSTDPWGMPLNTQAQPVSDPWGSTSPTGAISSDPWKTSPISSPPPKIGEFYLL